MICQLLGMRINTGVNIFHVSSFKLILCGLRIVV